jgi:hypothetical protein
MLQKSSPGKWRRFKRTIWTILDRLGAVLALHHPDDQAAQSAGEPRAPVGDGCCRAAITAYLAS